MDLSIITINYNTKDLLRDCLQSIKESNLDKHSYEIIVVDNNSADDLTVMAKEELNNVTLIQNKENLGFAKANNIGIRKARGRYLLFLNPDTKVTKNAIKAVLNYMEENKDVGVASPRVELANGELDEGCHRGFPTPWNAFAHFSGLGKLFSKSKLFSGYRMGWQLDNPAPHEVDSVVGAFYMVRREAGEEIGWWDEDYFWYGDELDFSYRLKKAGWRIVYIPSEKILHYKGASSGIGKSEWKITTASRETKIRAAKASTEAMRIFYKKHYSDQYPKFITWLVLSGINLLQTFRVLRYSLL